MNPPVSIKKIDRENKKVHTLAYLENAYEIEYTQALDTVSTCSIRLPADDPKAKYLDPNNLIEIEDNGESVGLFWIEQIIKVKEANSIYYNIIGYHAINSLSRILLFGLHQYTGLPVSETIQALLETEAEHGGRKQVDWDFGGSDYDNVIDYSFENVSVYSALQSITKNWKEPNMWVYDTSVYPFKVSLRRMSNEITSRLHSGYNLLELSVEDEYLAMANRYYALGSGEGVNQVNLLYAKDLESETEAQNEHYYVENAGSIEKYGLRESILVDRSITEPSLLLLAANEKLDYYSRLDPIIKVRAADVWEETCQPIDHFVPGQVCRIIEPELDYDEPWRIIRRTKPDLTGKPGDVELILGRMYNTIANAIDKVYNRDQEEKRTSQGATNIWTQSFGDNADADHPIEFVFRLPDDLLNVNKCVLDFTVSHFRTYSKGALGGGGGTSGSGTLHTTKAGGGGTSGSGTLATTESGGGGTSGAVTPDYVVNPGDPDHPYETDTYWDIYNPSLTNRKIEPFAETIPGSGNYQSPVQLGDPSDPNQMLLVFHHSHPHTHEVANHVHEVADHVHTLKDHVHEVEDHTHPLPEHTHDLEYGIYEEPTLAVTGVKIYVDGNLIGVSGLEGDGVDVLRLLTKGNDGKVIRGRHTVKIVPSPSGTGDGLCKIDGSLYIQCFIQSRGSFTL